MRTITREQIDFGDEGLSIVVDQVDGEEVEVREEWAEGLSEGQKDYRRRKLAPLIDGERRAAQTRPRGVSDRGALVAALPSIVKILGGDLDENELAEEMKSLKLICEMICGDA